MDSSNGLIYTAFPYIALTIFVFGHGSRYLADRYRWNARSSEILEKRQLFFGITVFHWGIIFAFIGHFGGLLIPQRLYNLVGFNSAAHTLIAHYSGAVIGTAAFVGLVPLLFRRIAVRRILLTTRINDFITLAGLIIVVASGLYNVFFGTYDVLDTVAPWIRGIVTFSPDPTLMRDVPLSYLIHVMSALALLAFSPFSRLVHIWSVPIGYFFRGWIEFRRKIVD